MTSKTKGRAAIERRLVDMTNEPLGDVPWLPGSAECLAEEFDFLLGTKAQMCVFLMTCDKRTVRFVLVQKARSRDTGRWEEVARVDTAHNEVHVHRFDRDHNQLSREVIRPIRSFADVGEGFDEAYDLMLNQWEDNERRWRDGR